MGKIRVKTLGGEDQEDEQKKRDEKRRASKRAKKEGGKVKTPGKSKGGERVVAVGPSEAEIEAVEKELKKKTSDASDEKTQEQTGKKEKKQSARPPKKRSKRYSELKKQVDRNKVYQLKEALKLVQKTSKTSFVGSIEAHINMRRTAKELSLKSTKKSVNPKAPKSPNSNALPISFEKKQPVAHATIGKTSDKEADLIKQYEAVKKYIGSHNIRKLTLSSTMGPGVKVSL